MKPSTVHPRALLVVILLTLVSLAGGGQQTAALADGSPPKTYLPLVVQSPLSLIEPANCLVWHGSFYGLVLSPAYERDNTLYLFGYEGPWETRVPLFYRSADRGRSWTDLPVPGRSIWGLAPSRQFEQDQTLYALMGFGTVGDGKVARSTDGGTTWEMRGSPPAHDNIIEFAVADRDTVFLGLSGEQPFYEDKTDGFYRSEDGGKKWTKTFVGGAWDLTLSPAFEQDQTIMFATGGYHYNGGVMRSTDAGRTWARASQGIYLYVGGTGPIRFSNEFARDHTVFTVSDYYLYTSTDGGDYWNRIAVDSRPYPTLWRLHISPYYAQDHTLWVAGAEERSYMTTDSGQTWRRIPDFVFNIEAIGSYCLADGRCGVELLRSARLEATYGQNIFTRSFDGGYTWHCLEDSYQPPL